MCLRLVFGCLAKNKCEHFWMRLIYIYIRVEFGICANFGFNVPPTFICNVHTSELQFHLFRKSLMTFTEIVQYRYTDSIGSHFCVSFSIIILDKLNYLMVFSLNLNFYSITIHCIHPEDISLNKSVQSINIGESTVV